MSGTSDVDMLLDMAREALKRERRRRYGHGLGVALQAMSLARALMGREAFRRYERGLQFCTVTVKPDVFGWLTEGASAPTQSAPPDAELREDI